MNALKRIEATLAEIHTVRAVGDHYLEGILARLEKALRGEEADVAFLGVVNPLCDPEEDNRG